MGSSGLSSDDWCGRAVRHRAGLCGHRIPRRAHPRRAAPGVRLGATRVGGVDLNKPRMRDALRAALALAPAPNGFTVAEFAAKVHALTGVDHCGYTVRQAGYDLRKLRGKQLVDKPGRTRRYQVAPRPRAPSPPCSPCATRSSPRSWPRCAAHAWDANPRTGPASTATTNESASICKHSSTISPSKPS